MEAEKIYKIHSNKYNIDGELKDYGMVTKLSFKYNEKKVEMGININPFSDKTPEEQGEQIIDSFIENIASDQKKLMMHYFKITEHKSKSTEEVFYQLHGRVTGHPKIADSNIAHTSYLKSIYVDFENDELIALTHSGSKYHCPLSYCDFACQDNFPDVIPGYEMIKEKYKDSIVKPSIDAGNVLLVLSNFDDYYFNSLYYVPENSETGESIEYCASAHIGMFQDSFLIVGEEEEIDLRYYPHYHNIKFYSQHTAGRPLYLENIGNSVLYAQTYSGLIKLKPGERKLVSKENAEEDKPILPNGDLYPAGVE